MSIIRQAGRVNGKVLWECRMADGAIRVMGMGEIACFHRAPVIR